MTAVDIALPPRATRSLRRLASITGALTPLLAFAAPQLAFAQAESSPALALTRAVGSDLAEFAAALDEKQRKRASYAFEDDERFDLRLAPLGLEGLTIRKMSEAQWSQLRGAFARVLSVAGLEKIETIRSLEAEVAELEGGLLGLFMSRSRDAKRYFLALFGDPDPNEVWGLRFDGHHLSLNWTATPGAPLSVTPLFLGGQPRQVPDGLERAGLRVLAEEEDLGLSLLRSLDDAGRAAAETELEQGRLMTRPMVVGADPQLELDPPQGLARGAMTPAQQQALDALIEVNLRNFAEPIAAGYRARIASEADSVHFLFAGFMGPAGPTAGVPSYYRVQGTSFLIEYDNTDDSADHIHVVWRDLDGDFGRDILAEHHRDQHGGGDPSPHASAHASTRD